MKYLILIVLLGACASNSDPDREPMGFWDGMAVGGQEVINSRLEQKRHADENAPVKCRSRRLADGSVETECQKQNGLY